MPGPPNPRSSNTSNCARPRRRVLAEPANHEAVPAGRTHADRTRRGYRRTGIVVDSHERYGCTFADKPVATTRQTLPCGDYGLMADGRLVAVVERKSLSDLTSGLLSGKFKYQLTELSALPRAAVVVEDRFSEIFTLTFARPAVVADGLAELQVGFPNVPIVFCQTRKLAQEYTYRYLAAAHTWFTDNDCAATVFESITEATPAADTRSGPNATELHDWARSVGLPASDRGRISREVLQALHHAHHR
jgi:hypothetical protein